MPLIIVAICSQCRKPIMEGREMHGPDEQPVCSVCWRRIAPARGVRGTLMTEFDALRAQALREAFGSALILLDNCPNVKDYLVTLAVRDVLPVFDCAPSVEVLDDIDEAGGLSESEGALSRMDGADVAAPPKATRREVSAHYARMKEVATAVCEAAMQEEVAVESSECVRRIMVATGWPKKEAQLRFSEFVQKRAQQMEMEAQGAAA